MMGLMVLRLRLVPCVECLSDEEEETLLSGIVAMRATTNQRLIFWPGLTRT
jgi:hypothetical protein